MSFTFSFKGLWYLLVFAHHPNDRNVSEAFSAVYMSPLRVLKATVPGQEFLSSCRHPRKSSSLPQERSLSPETPSSMWLERLTSSVSLSHEKKKNRAELWTKRFLWWTCCCSCFLDDSISADIGHVDFLEMVYKQAERPYVIVGLHFDQVHLKIEKSFPPCCVSSFQEKHLEQVKLTEAHN